MQWRPLRSFRDARIGKLHRLGRAAHRGLEVPETVWAELDGVPAEVPVPPVGVPCIVRSASPDEDTDGSTAAGRFASVVAASRDELAAAVREVLESMGGSGVLFAQPLAERLLGPGARGGVLFFDGHHFERTEDEGHNRAVTAGESRGEVLRGDLERGDPFSDWLRRLARVFHGELCSAPALDVEYARAGDRHVLLQARPARFPVRRNPVLSLANHREILGELPSPWVVDALVRAGEGAVEEFARVDPEVGTWGARYAEAHGGRAWLSFSFFFRLMDHWGLPRSFVTEGVGGEDGGPLDRRLILGRMLRKAPRLVRLQLQNRAAVRRIPESLARFDAAMDEARDLGGWFRATAVGLDVALRTNFAINGALSGIVRVRRALGVRGRARVITEDMMRAYDELRGLSGDELERGFAGWLERFGHRGPLESDPMQPRFRELADVLLEDLRGSPEAAPAETAPGRAGWWFRMDAVRERFRDQLMVRWERLRAGILAAAAEAHAAGDLDDPEDAFLLGAAAEMMPAVWRDLAADRRAERERLVSVRLPLTARLDEIEQVLEGAGAEAAGASDELRGIGIGDRVVTGQVVRASELPALLREIESGARPPLGSETVLHVPALEPSWGILFGRIGAVVTDIGGELSHASILLREAGATAVVNCAGASASLRDGETVTVDPRRGVVRRED